MSQNDMIEIDLTDDSAPANPTSNENKVVFTVPTNEMLQYNELSSSCVTNKKAVKRKSVANKPERILTWLPENKHNIPKRKNKPVVIYSKKETQIVTPCYKEISKNVFVPTKSIPDKPPPRLYVRPDLFPATRTPVLVDVSHQQADEPSTSTAKQPIEQTVVEAVAKPTRVETAVKPKIVFNRPLKPTTETVVKPTIDETVAKPTSVKPKIVFKTREPPVPLQTESTTEAGKKAALAKKQITTTDNTSVQESLIDLTDNEPVTTTAEPVEKTAVETVNATKIETVVNPTIVETAAIVPATAQTTVEPEVPLQTESTTEAENYPSPQITVLTVSPVVIDLTDNETAVVPTTAKPPIGQTTVETSAKRETAPKFNKMEKSNSSGTLPAPPMSALQMLFMDDLASLHQRYLMALQAEKTPDPDVLKYFRQLQKVYFERMKQGHIVINYDWVLPIPVEEYETIDLDIMRLYVVKMSKQYQAHKDQADKQILKLLQSTYSRRLRESKETNSSLQFTSNSKKSYKLVLDNQPTPKATKGKVAEKKPTKKANKPTVNQNQPSQKSMDKIKEQQIESVHENQQMFEKFLANIQASSSKPTGKNQQGAKGKQQSANKGQGNQQPATNKKVAATPSTNQQPAKPVSIPVSGQAVEKTTKGNQQSTNQGQGTQGNQQGTNTNIAGASSTNQQPAKPGWKPVLSQPVAKKSNPNTPSGSRPNVIEISTNQSTSTPPRANQNTPTPPRTNQSMPNPSRCNHSAPSTSRTNQQPTMPLSASMRAPAGIPRSFLRDREIYNNPGRPEPTPPEAPIWKKTLNPGQYTPVWPTNQHLHQPGMEPIFLDTDQAANVGQTQTYSPSDAYAGEQMATDSYTQGSHQLPISHCRRQARLGPVALAKKPKLTRTNFIDKPSYSTDPGSISPTAGDKRASAYSRLGPVAPPKKPKLTINLLFSKEQESRREVVEPPSRPPHVPVPERPEVLASTDETVIRYLAHWPWRRRLAPRREATHRESKSVMIMEMEQMMEGYESDTHFIKVSIKRYPPHFTKEDVLDLLLDHVKDRSFIPCFIEFTPEECYFLVLRNRAALVNLHSIGLQIIKDDLKMPITLSIVDLSVNHVEFIPRIILRKRLSHKYDADAGKLNLEAFCMEPDVGHFIYYPLNRTTNQLALVQIATVVEWAHLTELNLSRNRLTCLDGFELPTTTPKLKHLDLSHNHFTKISSLLPSRGLNLKSLYLEGNPLCRDYIDEQRYVKVVRMVFPTVDEIDGVQIPRPGSLPPPRANYCPSDATPLVRRYLAVCLSVPAAREWYHPRATLSVTACNRLRHHPDYRSFRELCQPANNVRGAAPVSARLARWPARRADPASLLVDVMMHTDETTILRLSGIIKIIAETLAEDEPLLYFTRTVVLCGDGVTYSIMHEMIHWEEPTVEAADKAFNITMVSRSKPLSLKLDSPPDEDLKGKLIAIFMKITELDKEKSEKCLELRDWDLKAALEYFVKLLKLNSLSSLEMETLEV
ncbi:mucin-5AC [Plutella xylostella]|uniref:mucin-5AC n=1 Tax=Plutella xylostella TaxID=51655 RepID=UPI00203250F9|nr:mucin-5AC [Plutella xylostella]